MQMIVRVVRLIGFAFILLIAGFAVFVAVRQNLRFDRPLPDVVASTDSSVVARGEYLVRSVADCAGCHGDPARLHGADLLTTPLIGGNMWDIPPGKFYARNITPDVETGIGGASDAAIARALRYGVGIDGRALLPFMEFQGLSDDDLLAIVSYLRAQAPVEHEVPMHHYTLLGRVVKATVLADPVGPAETPPAVAPREVGVETGRYLAGSVALCWGCHTERSPNTGELLGPRFSGARSMPGEAGGDTVYAPPNLTPDPTTGRLMQLGLTEDGFVERFRAGRVYAMSPMPWEVFATMHDDDLRSIYRFLMSLPPVVHDVGPGMRVQKAGS